MPSLPPGVKLLRTFSGHMGWVTRVAFDPLGETLASAGPDGTIKLWDRTSGELLRTLEELTSRVYSLAFDPSGGILASGISDSKVRLWETTSGKLLRTLEANTL